MTRLIIIIVVSLVMLVLTPFKGVLAISADSPWYTHITYMFAHANILHWAINAYALVLLHHHITLTAVVTAVVTAVGISFLPVSSPLLGASVITFFFVGTLATRLYRYNSTAFWQCIIFLIVAFFLPAIAALQHLIAFLIGMAYHTISNLIQSYRTFYSEQ